MKRIAFSLIFALSLSHSIQALDIPGTLPGEVVVNNQGAASYTIPIEVIPGTGGLQPELKFIYSSSGGNGPLGIGWSIGGLSQITRVGQNLFFDGSVSGVMLNTDTSGNLLDRFSLDGQRLVDVDTDNSYWKSSGANEYRTAVDNFAHVKAYGLSGDGPAYFEVQTKDGHKMIYGNTTISSASQVIVNGSVYTWLLSRIVDTAGNYMDFHYTNTYGEGNFSPLIDHIDYTGNINTALVPYNRVKFNYDTQSPVRPDKNPIYLLGNKLQLNGFLRSIELQENIQTTPVTTWQYSLSYKTDYSVQGPLLKLDDIQYKYTANAQHEFLPETGFEWFGGSTEPTFSKPPISNSTIGPWLNPNTERRVTTLIDLDDDGTFEVLNIFESGMSLVSEIFNIVDGVLVKKDTLTISDLYYGEQPLFWDINRLEVGIGDLDGDGIKEAHLWVETEGGYKPVISYDNWRMLKLNPAGQSVMHSNAPPSYDETLRRIVAHDWDGDGIDEIGIVYAEESQNDITIRVFPSALTDMSTYSEVFHEGNYGHNNLSYSINEVDGDGAPDVIVNRGSEYWDCLIGSDGSANSYKLLKMVHDDATLTNLRDPDADGTATFIDWNNDGYGDLFDYYKSNNKTFARVYLNKGQIVNATDGVYWGEVRFETTALFDVEIYSQYDKEGKPVFFDYNGDGLIDLGFIPKDTDSNYDYTKLRYFRNTGSTIVYDDEYTVLSSLDGQGGWDKDNDYQASDYNEDGCWGILTFQKSGSDLKVHVTDSSGPLQNKLFAVTNGLGERTELNYLPLTDPTVYEPGYRLGYPFETLVGPMRVVSSVFKDTGLRDASGDPILHESWFMYAEGRSHMRGLGFLGFEQFESYDPQRQVSKVEIVEQAFPMTGLVKYTATHYWGSGPIVRDSSSLPRSQRQSSATLDRFILTEVESTVICDAVSGGTMFPMITQSEEKSWEFSNGRAADSFNSGTKRYDATVAVVKNVKTQTWFDHQYDYNSPTTVPVTSLPGGVAIDQGDPQDWVTQAVGLGDEQFSTERAYFPASITYGNVRKTFIDYNQDGMSTKTVNWYHNWNQNDDWLLGRVFRSNITEAKSGYPSVLREAVFGYYIDTGLLQWEKNCYGNDIGGSTNNDPLTNVTSYERDAYGNILKEWKEGHFELVNGDPDSWTTYELRQVLEREMDTATHRFAVKEYGPMALISGTSYYKAFYTEYQNYNPMGKPQTVIGVNGGTTQTAYDGLGRVISVTRPFGVADSTTERYDLTASPITFQHGTYPKQTAVMAVLEKSNSEGPESNATAQVAAVSYLDVHGRTILERKDIYGSPDIPMLPAATTTAAIYAFKASYYNADGMLVAASDWSKEIDISGTSLTGLTHADVVWATNEYDDIGRLSAAVAGNSNRTEYVYNGLTTQSTVNVSTLSESQYNQRTDVIKDARDREVQTIRYVGTDQYKVENIYDPIGNLHKVKRTYPGAQTVQTEFTYDGLGRKLTMDDPDTGLWEYRHNFIGELLYQEDNKNNVTLLVYDRAGNIKYRYRNGARTDFVFNWNPRTGAFKEIGVLDSETQNYAPYVQKFYSYRDSDGLLDLEWTGVDGKWFYKTYGYDDYRRPEAVGYYWKADGDTDYSLSSDWHPYIVQNFYDSKGYLVEVKGQDTAPNFTTLPIKTWWSLNSSGDGYDDKDRVDIFNVGTALYTDLDYDATDGTIENIKTVRPSDGLTLQDNSFDFDKLGRLRWRQEHEQSLQGGQPTWNTQRKEEFWYDSLNRVTHRQVTFGGSSDPSEIITVYDHFGNVTWHPYQPQGGNLSYSDSSRPNRLTAAGGAAVYYDANGNISWQYRSSLGGWVGYSWNAANKLSAVYGNSTADQIDFQYDAQDNLVTQFRRDGGVYQEKKLYLMGYEQSYMNVSSSSVDWKLDYTRISISTPAGVVGTYEWPGEYSGAPTPLEGFRRFFHYDHQGSVVLVTDEYGDEIKRFSYDVFGGDRNPLTWTRNLTDSVLDHEDGADAGYTGHEMLDDFDLIHMGGRVYDPQLARFLSPDPVVQMPGNTQNYNRYTYALNNPLSYTDPSGYFLQFIPMILFAAGKISFEVALLAVMATTAASTLIMGGSLSDAFKAALIAGASMVVAAGIGDLFGPVADSFQPLKEFGRAMAHGITSGGFSELGGGDFQSGFLAGFAGSLGGSVMKVNSGPGEMFATKEARVIGAAIVGGTASELGGGKFMNGAVTGALIQAFNHENSHQSGNGKKKIGERLQKQIKNFVKAVKEGIVKGSYVNEDIGVGFGFKGKALSLKAAGRVDLGLYTKEGDLVLPGISLSGELGADGIATWDPKFSREIVYRFDGPSGYEKTTDLGNFTLGVAKLDTSQVEIAVQGVFLSRKFQVGFNLEAFFDSYYSNEN